MRPLDPDLAMRRLGQRIAEIRAERGLTPEALAERGDVSVRWIQMVEGGQNITVRSMVRIANMLKVGLTDLVARPTGGPSRVARPRAHVRK